MRLRGKSVGAPGVGGGRILRPLRSDVRAPTTSVPVFALLCTWCNAAKSQRCNAAKSQRLPGRALRTATNAFPVHFTKCTGKSGEARSRHALHRWWRGADFSVTSLTASGASSRAAPEWSTTDVSGVPLGNQRVVPAQRGVPGAPTFPSLAEPTPTTSMPW